MWHLPLPALILALAGTAQLIRIMRANLLDELRKPYVVTARAKGLSEMRVDLEVSGARRSQSVRQRRSPTCSPTSCRAASSSRWC